MKTLREILLRRHQAAEPKLDQIRDMIVSDLGRRRVSYEYSLPAAIVFKLWRELILPCRRTWAGLAVVWFVIAMFNLTNSDINPQIAASSPTQSAEMRLVFQEQQRVLAELVGAAQSDQTVATPRRDEPQPRSDIQSGAIAA